MARRIYDLRLLLLPLCRMVIVVGRCRQLDVVNVAYLEAGVLLGRCVDCRLRLRTHTRTLTPRRTRTRAHFRIHQWQ